MVFETLQPVLSSYFLNPNGIIALSALLPLAIFYLIRRKPDRKTLPSMRFFNSGEDMESTSQAFKRLMRNLVLLLHILIVIGFTLAFSEPFLTGPSNPKKTILILDQSASMEGDFHEAKKFLRTNLGEKNTVILVDDEAELVATELSKKQARSIINNARLKDTETDIVSGLQTAGRMKGNIIIGSDLDQTVNQQSIKDILRKFRTQNREFDVMDTKRRNSWGITGLDVNRENTTIEIKNFQSKENLIRVSGTVSKQLAVPGNSIEKLTVKSTSGRNTLKLEKDKFEADNDAYFYIPKEKKFNVILIADEKNPFLIKVFELIDFTNIEYLKPPIEENLNADLYIIGKTDRIISETVQKIESQVENGKNLVLFGNQDISKLGFSNLPVKDQRNKINTSVNIEKPIRVPLGNMQIRNLRKISGQRYSSRSNAIIKSAYGAGEILIYNINDSKFNKDFLYPIFWKKISAEMLERKSVEELNFITGNTITEEKIISPDGKEKSGRLELEQEGFYNTSRGTIAVNMFSSDESLREEINVMPNTISSDKTKKSLQDSIILLLIILALGELAYLYRIGDFR